MEKPRKGNTIVTSVSLSKQFKDLLIKFNISPTDAIRKGIAIELYDLGIPQYITELNKNRSLQIKEILKTDELDILLKDLKKLEEDIKNFKSLREVK